MKKLLRFAFLCVLAGTITSLAVSAAKADCTTDRLIGVGKANALDAAMLSYDTKATAYNQSIKAADTAFAANENIDSIWPVVLVARDGLVQAGQTALLALSDMNRFNQQYISSGCFNADAAKLEQEYKNNKSTFDSALQTLGKVPDNWQDRYGVAAICRTIKTRDEQANIRGAQWSATHDRLISAYDLARKNTLALPNTDPAYPELRKKLILARDQALPGVIGYPEIIGSIFDLTLLNLDNGCFAMTAEALKTYRQQQTTLQAEIRKKLSEMQSIESDFPLVSTLSTKTLSAVEQTTTPRPSSIKPAPKTPAIALRKQAETLPSMAGNISFRNRSGDVLCLFDAISNETLCNLMAGVSRTITSTQITAFGGGYWTPDGKYMEMKTCRILKPSLQKQAILPGKDPQCSPPSL